MVASSHRSAATLGRLALRLTIVLILSALWSGDSPARAAGVLCFLFALAVLWTAHAWGEMPTGNGLNRWHEGAFLVVLGLVLFFWFGRGLASDRRSSLEFFEASDWWKPKASIEAPIAARLGGHADDDVAKGFRRGEMLLDVRDCGHVRFLARNC
jgi:hypothetical protein